MRATADMLQGQVNVPCRHRNRRPASGPRTVSRSPPTPSSSARSTWPTTSRVKGGVVIHGPSVVGDYTIVDSRAQIDRSVIWNNSYIGERAEMRGAMVGPPGSIKSKAMMFEGVVIGDHTVVNEGAIIQPGVKIWPNKEIETGAVVTTSIIWGSQGRRSLFGRYGVTGLVNVDLTPEFAAKLGAAYGAVLPKGSVVCVNRDAHAPRACSSAPSSPACPRPASTSGIWAPCRSPSPATTSHNRRGGRRPYAPLALRPARG